MKTVCVTGASGCIGQALLKRLMGKYNVRALFRAETEMSRYWEDQGCEVVLGSLSDQASITRLVVGAAVVFHCAATMAKGDYDKSYDVNVRGTKLLAEEAARAKCRVFVHVSSISVYAATQTPDHVIAEEIAPDHVDQLNHYSYTKYLSEQVVKEVCQAGSMHYIVIRPTNVYGPYSKPWFLSVVALVRKVPVLIGDLELDFVHVDDVAKAMVQAAQSEAALDQTFHVGHERLPLREFFATVARLLNRRYWFLPRPVDSLLRRSIDVFYRRATGKRTSYSFVRPVSYPSLKARASFEYIPEVNLYQGLSQTVFWFFQRNQDREHVSHRPYLKQTKKIESVERVRASSELEIIEAVQRARDLKISIKPVGSMGSKNKNFHTAGISIDLSEFNDLTSIRGELVTVQAGMKLFRLYELLKMNGLALSNVGEWSGPSVGGALSTGTHGGSIHFGTMSSLLHSVKIVLADGATRFIGRDHELFDYVGLSVGMFGVISEATFQCVPHFRLQLQKECVSIAKFVRYIDELNSHYAYFNAIWVPPAGKVLIYEANPTEVARSPVKRDRRYSLKHDLFYFLSNQFGLTSLWKEKVFRHSVVGDWDEILAPLGRSGFLVQYILDYWKVPKEIEVSVPVEHAADVLFELDAFFRAKSVYPSLPVGLRCGGREPFKLSPCYKRDALWITVFVKNNEMLLSQLSSVLAHYRCRFHWGKNVTLPEDYVKAQYACWEEVVRLKRQLDPDSLFADAFTRRFFA